MDGAPVPEHPANDVNADDANANVAAANADPTAQLFAAANAATANDATANDATADDSTQFFKTPAHLLADIPHESIPFLNAKNMSSITPESCFAIRLNEYFTDAKAIFENERAYVRQAANRAQTIVAFRCATKKPILILSDFQKLDIQGTNSQKVIDATAERVRFINGKISRVEYARPDKTSRIRCRIMSTPEILGTITDKTTQVHQLIQSATHIKNVWKGQLVLTDEEIAGIARTVLIEKMVHIETSFSKNRQVTLRCPEATLPEVLDVGLKLQAQGATVTLRTYGTLRVTLPENVDRTTFSKLKQQFPKFLVYLDTPVNVWARAGTECPANHVPNNKTGKPRSAAFTAAQEKGQVVARLMAHFPPIPEDFHYLAKHFGGTVIECCQDKYADVPTVCLCAFPPASLDVLQELQQNPFGDGQEIWSLQILSKPRVVV